MKNTQQANDERHQPSRRKGVLPGTPGEPALGAGILPGTPAEKREDERSRSEE